MKWFRMWTLFQHDGCWCQFNTNRNPQFGVWWRRIHSVQTAQSWHSMATEQFNSVTAQWSSMRAQAALPQCCSSAPLQLDSSTSLYTALLKLALLWSGLLHLNKTAPFWSIQLYSSTAFHYTLLNSTPLL